MANVYQALYKTLEDKWSGSTNQLYLFTPQGAELTQFSLNYYMAFAFSNGQKLSLKLHLKNNEDSSGPMYYELSDITYSDTSINSLFNLGFKIKSNDTDDIFATISQAGVSITSLVSRAEILYGGLSGIIGESGKTVDDNNIIAEITKDVNIVLPKALIEDLEITGNIIFPTNAPIVTADLETDSISVNIVDENSNPVGTVSIPDMTKDEDGNITSVNNLMEIKLSDGDKIFEIKKDGSLNVNKDINITNGNMNVSNGFLNADWATFDTLKLNSPTANPDDAINDDEFRTLNGIDTSKTIQEHLNDKANEYHASEDLTYGRGSSTFYGHNKLSDDPIGEEDVYDGVSATPKAVSKTIPKLLTEDPDISSTDRFEGELYFKIEGII